MYTLVCTRDDYIFECTMKNPHRNQKQFHSRYNFGYGILFFSPKTTNFDGFEGVFSYISDKSAIPCPTKTEVADFVSFKK